MSVVIEFLGATGTVTGSRFLVRSDRADGPRRRGNVPGVQPRSAPELGAVPGRPARDRHRRLTHAHIDHSGWLPGLVRDGFTGPIIATQTRDSARSCCPTPPTSMRSRRGSPTSGDTASTTPPCRCTRPRTPRASLAAVPRRCRSTPPSYHRRRGHRVAGAGRAHPRFGLCALTINDTGDSTTVLVSGDLGRGNHPAGGRPWPSTRRKDRADRIDLRRFDPPPAEVEIEKFADVIVGRPPAEASCSSRPSPSIAPRSCCTVLSELMQADREPVAPRVRRQPDGTASPRRVPPGDRRRRPVGQPGIEASRLRSGTADCSSVPPWTTRSR